jgi:hypothetical protein
VDSNVSVEATIELEFGDTNMLKDLTTIQQYKILQKWVTKLVDAHTQVCIT